MAPRFPFASPHCRPFRRTPWPSTGKAAPRARDDPTLPFRNAPTPGPFGAQDKRGEGRASDPRWPFRIPFATPHAQPFRRASQARGRPRPGPAMGPSSLSQRPCPAPSTPLGLTKEKANLGPAMGPSSLSQRPCPALPTRTAAKHKESRASGTRWPHASLSHRPMPGPFDAQDKRGEGRASGAQWPLRSPFATRPCPALSTRIPAKRGEGRASDSRWSLRFPFATPHAQPFRRASQARGRPRLALPILIPRAPVGQGLGHVSRANLLLSLHVRQGSCQLQHPRVGAHG